MELVSLTVLLEFGLVLVHLLGAWRAVLIAEDAEQRAAKILCHIEWRDRRLRVELLFGHHDAAAPEIGTGVHVLPLAGVEESVPATGTGAKKTDLAVVVGLLADPLHRSLCISDHLGIGNAALGANFGCNVIR